MFEWNDGVEFYHSGVKGQKWGIRRYQNEDGSLTALGRVHYGIGEARKTAKSVYDTVADPIRQYKRNKARKQALEKARKTREENKRKADELERILKSGTAEEINANRSNFTPQQLREAKERLDAERGISQMIPREKTKLDKAEKVFSNIGRIGGMINNASNTWNAVSRVMNGVFGMNMTAIPTVDQLVASKGIKSSGGNQGNQNNNGNNNQASGKKKKKAQQEAMKIFTDSLSGLSLEEIVQVIPADKLKYFI